VVRAQGVHQDEDHVLRPWRLGFRAGSDCGQREEDGEEEPAGHQSSRWIK
jgi:hypothetical protein